MKYAYLIKFIFGRANFGLIATDVEVRFDNVEEGYDDKAFCVFKQGSRDPIVTHHEEIQANDVLGEEETEFMVGNDLEEMIQIFNQQSVDLYKEDLMERFEKMKSNLNVTIDIDL